MIDVYSVLVFAVGKSFIFCYGMTYLLLIAMNRLAKFILPILLIGIFLIAPTIPTAEAQPPTIYVDPPSRDVVVSTQFTVTVKVADVTDLCSAQFNMTFDPKLLECKDITEGPFLKSGIGTTFFVTNINNDAGWILVACLLLPTDDVWHGVTGDGELAFVVFHCKGAGRSDLEFDVPGTMLLVVAADPTDEPVRIPYQPIGGSVTQYTRAVGGVLVPVNKLTVLAPYLALISLVGAVTVAVAATRRRKT